MSNYNILQITTKVLISLHFVISNVKKTLVVVLLFELFYRPTPCISNSKDYYSVVFVLILVRGRHYELDCRLFGSLWRMKIDNPVLAKSSLTIA